jgi:hypothetical protein
MNGSLTYYVAQARIDDLLRVADDRRRAGGAALEPHGQSSRVARLARTGLRRAGRLLAAVPIPGRPPHREPGASITPTNGASQPPPATDRVAGRGARGTATQTRRVGAAGVIEPGLCGSPSRSGLTPHR